MMLEGAKADWLWGNLGCLKLSWSAALAFHGFPQDGLDIGFGDCLLSCICPSCTIPHILTPSSPSIILLQGCGMRCFHTSQSTFQS